MPFFEHLSELRRRLVIMIASVSVVSLVVYTWAWRIYDFIMRPVLPYLKEAGAKELVTLGPFEGFTLRFRVSLYAAIVICSPIIIWQIMAFFLPALKPKERKYVIPTFAAMVALFVGGITFCYIVVLPAAFAWMIGQLGGAVGVMPDAGRWFGGVMLLLLAFGIGFQIPVVVFYLMIFNIVPYRTLRHNWRIAYVALMVLSAVATPDWSPVTMGALFGALIILYEASMALARVVLSRRIAEQRRLEAAEAAEA
jgi:sec-independent protein translocase protein TatC